MSEQPLPFTGPIVVGFDDHATSRRALLQAVELAERLHVHLRVVHVLDAEDVPVDPDSAQWDAERQWHAEQLERDVHELVRLPDRAWSYAAATGEVWKALTREARDLDAWLVVIGQHTHAHAVATAVGRLLRGTWSGSATDALVHHSRLSVLVVPHHDDEA